MAIAPTIARNNALNGYTMRTTLAPWRGPAMLVSPMTSIQVKLAELQSRNLPPPRASTVADGHDELGRRRGFVGLPQRHFHVPSHGARDQEKVSMTRRGHEVEAEALAVVDRAHQARDLDLAAIAGARVHLADAQSPAEEAPRAAVDFANEVNDLRITGRNRLGDYARAKNLGEEAHLLWPAPPHLGHDRSHYNRISRLSRRYSRAG